MLNLLRPLCLITVLFTGIIFTSSCGKSDNSPSDQFTGVYTTPDGWELMIGIVKEGYYGEITKTGAPRGGFATPTIADPFLLHGVKEDEKTLSGEVRTFDFSALVPGTLILEGEQMTITPGTGNPYVLMRVGK